LDFVVPTFHDEEVTLLVNGNQAFAAAGQAVTGANELALVVSPVIERLRRGRRPRGIGVAGLPRRRRQPNRWPS
jgi:hypothetical protein